MPALISVLIAAYNHEKYVQETIQSIIDQTYQNIELIVIDDGSPDSTWEKINHLKKVCEDRFVRVIFKRQKNQGVCTTVNRMLECASGDYIFGIASDDIAAPDAIEILHDFLSKNEDYAIAVGENILIDSESKVCYWDGKRKVVYDWKDAEYRTFTDYLIKKNRRVDFNSEDFGSYESLLAGNYIPNGYLIRKEIYNKTGCFNKDAPLEDYWLMLQISKYAKMKYINKPTFYYRWHGANTMLQDDKMIYITAKTLAYEMDFVKTFDDKKYEEIVSKTLGKNAEKLVFSIPFLMKLYKRRTLIDKATILSIFGWRIILKNISFLNQQKSI